MRHLVAPELSRLEEIADYCETEDMDTLIHRLREVYGVKHVTYHSFFKNKSHETIPYIKTTYPPDWVSRYITMAYMSIDPVVESGFGRILPFDWADLDRTGEIIQQLFWRVERIWNRAARIVNSDSG